MKTQLFVFTVSVMVITATIASPVSGDLSNKDNSAKIRQSPPPAFAFFRTHRQGAGVTATWGLTSEEGIECFMVQRTYEDPTDPYAVWDDICLMSCNSTRSYRHTDQNVSPGYITYRVIAYFQFGGSMMSEYSTERVVAH